MNSGKLLIKKKIFGSSTVWLIFLSYAILLTGCNNDILLQQGIKGCVKECNITIWKAERKFGEWKKTNKHIYTNKATYSEKGWICVSTDMDENGNIIKKQLTEERSEDGAAKGVVYDKTGKEFARYKTTTLLDKKWQQKFYNKKDEMIAIRQSSLSQNEISETYYKDITNKIKSKQTSFWENGNVIRKKYEQGGSVLNSTLKTIKNDSKGNAIVIIEIFDGDEDTGQYITLEYKYYNILEILFS